MKLNTFNEGEIKRERERENQQYKKNAERIRGKEVRENKVH
jgi:hypothetical protein